MINKSNIPKKNPFRVPENYFEEAGNRIISVATGQKNNESTRTRILSVFLAAAASVAVLIIAGYFFMKSLTENHNVEIAEQALPVNEFLLYELDILTLEDSTTVSGIMNDLPDMERSEIIDYLVQEDIDMALIYEQL